MADSYIKPDPELAGASPGILDEDDIYEDAGDLEFNTDPKFQKLYLARIPKHVWEAWSKLDDDAEIQIGTIRQASEMMPNGEQKTSLSMLLSSDLAEHQMVPKEFILDVTEQDVKNTFVFTEQDLPGFKSKSRMKFDPASANMPSRLNRAKNEKPAAKQYDPNKRFQPYFRKAIPKRTTLAGRIAHEVNCVPVDNEENQRILSIRTFEAMQPKVEAQFLGKEDVTSASRGFVQPGTVAAQAQWQEFIIKAGRKDGKKAQLTKTARMPQNELLDKIFECFKKYQYWSMKAFRQELQQPEAYLRETLERVAILHKSGRFATHWQLKPENQISNYEELGESMAPTTGADGVDDEEFVDEDDEEDEDIKFEDVPS